MTYFERDSLNTSLHYSIMHHLVRSKEFFEKFLKLTNEDFLKYFGNILGKSLTQRVGLC